jgi:hypothetical protein
MRQAVNSTSGIDAACSQPRSFGFGTTLKAGTFANSASAVERACLDPIS